MLSQSRSKWWAKFNLMLNFGLLAPLWAALIWTIAVTSQYQCVFYCWLLTFYSKKKKKREKIKLYKTEMSAPGSEWVTAADHNSSVTAWAEQKNLHYCLFQSPHCTSSQERVSLTIRSLWHHCRAPSLCKPRASLSITVNTQLLNVNLYLISRVRVCVFVCVCVCDEALMWEGGGASLWGQMGSTGPFQKWQIMDSVGRPISVGFMVAAANDGRTQKEWESVARNRQEMR